MRAYTISPPFEVFGTDDLRKTAALDLVTDIVVQCLRRCGDVFQVAVVWADPGTEPGTSYHDDIAQPHVFRFETEESLRDWVRKSVDPFVNSGGTVRSMATCRTVTFGYDGQALLLLRHEDSPPCTPDPRLVAVEERPELVSQSDWFDGWVRPEANSGSD